MKNENSKRADKLEIVGVCSWCVAQSDQRKLPTSNVLGEIGFKGCRQLDFWVCSSGCGADSDAAASSEGEATERAFIAIKFRQFLRMRCPCKNRVLERQYHRPDFP